MKLQLEQLGERIAPSSLTDIWAADVQLIQAAMQAQFQQMETALAPLVPPAYQQQFQQMTAQMENYLTNQLPGQMNSWFQNATPQQQQMAIDTIAIWLASGQPMSPRM